MKMDWKRLKIFFKLKAKEIFRFVQITSVLILLFGFMIFMAVLLYTIMSFIPNEILDIIFAYIGYIIIISFFGFIAFGILYEFQNWIMENWKEAGKIARKEK